MKHTNTICAALGLFIGITTSMQEAHTTLSLQENTLRNHNEHARLVPLKKLIGKINIFGHKKPHTAEDLELSNISEKESSSDELMKLSDISPEEKIERIHNSISRSPREKKCVMHVQNFSTASYLT